MTVQAQIVLQARFDSRRLPGKALLPIADLPMVVLAARRAARSGMNLVVATSNEPSDDHLARVCEAAGLLVHRGPLDDVYARFLGATAGLPDDAIVVRLTADNVFPDADLIEALIEVLSTRAAAYVAPRWPDNGLPYGVMAEAFRLGALRRAPPQSGEDAEHVTAALARSNRNDGFQSSLQLAHLRSTVDTPEDFSCVRQAFEGIGDPIRIGWTELCHRLAALPQIAGGRVPWTHHQGRPQSRLTLGTAQLGMPYGIANATGVPDAAEIARIVHGAIERGVTHIDTARVYGESEARLGAALAGGFRQRVNLITKLAPITDGDAAAVRAAVDASISQSCRALRTGRLDIVLLHRAAARRVAGGAAWRRLLELKQEGTIGLLGISAQSPQETGEATRDPQVDAIQLPFNLLDHRWAPPGRLDLLVHARSVFLQGLLTGLPSERWPQIPGVDAGALLQDLAGLARELGRSGVADLALAFVRAQSWIHSLVVGIETHAQLQENLALFAAPPLDDEGLALVRRRLPILPDMLLDPARWPRS